MTVRFEEVRETAANIKTFVFRPPRPIKYTAGQFIELTLPHPDSDKRGIKRWFTLSSSPTEDYLSITTKLAAENGSTFKAALQRLSPGDDVAMSSPMGDFVLPKDASKPIVFVAGGIGVTPMRSMIKSLVDAGEKRDIHLIYAANTAAEFAFSDLFETAAIKLSKVVREAPSGWAGESGMLDGQRIIDLSGGSPDKLFYLSGPEPMVEAFEKAIKSLGAKNVVTDFFPGYSEL